MIAGDGAVVNVDGSRPRSRALVVDTAGRRRHAGEMRVIAIVAVLAATAAAQPVHAPGITAVRAGTEPGWYGVSVPAYRRSARFRLLGRDWPGCYIPDRVAVSAAPGSGTWVAGPGTAAATRPVASGSAVVYVEQPVRDRPWRAAVRLDPGVCLAAVPRRPPPGSEWWAPVGGIFSPRHSARGTWNAEVEF